MDDPEFYVGRCRECHGITAAMGCKGASSADIADFAKRMFESGRLFTSADNETVKGVWGHKHGCSMTPNDE